MKAPIAKFVALAVLLAGGNTYGSTLAATQFLDVAGSEQLPLYYVLSPWFQFPSRWGSRAPSTGSPA